MSSKVHFAYLSCVLLLLISCGRASDQSEAPERLAPARAAAPEGSASGPQGLPAPSEALRSLSYADYEKYRYGADYEDALPSRYVLRDGNAAAFWPQGEQFAGLSYATYRFTLQSFFDDTAVHFQWSVPPALANFRVALANWTADRWDWFTPGSTELAEFFDKQPYFTFDGTCLVIVAVSGKQPCELDHLSLGLSAGPAAPEIKRVAPQGGTSGSQVRFSADVTGTQTLNYAWDFGGGADPNTASGLNPLVTLGPQGHYPARLTVSNRKGSAVYDFDLHVEPTTNWVHTFGKPDRDWVEGVAADAAGNVYAAINGSYAACVIKLDPLGNLQWSKQIQGLDQDDSARLYHVLLAPDGSLLLAGGLGHGWDNEPDRSCFFLRMSTEGAAQGYVELPGIGGCNGKFDVAADGSILTGNQMGGVLARFDSSGTLLWSVALATPDLQRWPDSSQACFAEDGSVYIAGTIDLDNNGVRGSFLSHLDADGNLAWTRYNGEVGDKAVLCLCRIPGGAFMAVGPGNLNGVNLNPADNEVLAIDASGTQIFAKHRESALWLNRAVYANGAILISGAAQHKTAAGSTYFTNLQSYSLLGEELGAVSLFDLPYSAVPFGLAVHPDGSVLLYGCARNNYISAVPVADPPEDGPTAAYSDAQLVAPPVTLTVQSGAYSLTDYTFKLDTAAAATDTQNGMVMKLAPPG